MFNPDSELKIPIRLDDYKQQRSGGYSTAPFSMGGTGFST